MATHKVNGLVIQTSHIRPPIGTLRFDWSATLDSYDGAPDAGLQPIGYGATEAAAIEDLRTQIDEKDSG
jgi:hypothetical protein